jgi:hypothetical protein
MEPAKNLPVPVITMAAGEPVLKGILVLWDAEAGWHDRDGQPVPSPLLVLHTDTCVRRWQNHELVDEIVEKPLPDVKTLNEAIPVEEWEIGMDGKPRPPYALYHLAYLLNPVDAQLFTYINCTIGCTIAIQRLQESMRWMQAMRGQVFPLVRLDRAPMRTKQFGIKSRPNFVVLEYRELGGSAVGAPKPTPQLGKPVEKPSTKEAIQDDLPPWNDNLGHLE